MATAAKARAAVIPNVFFIGDDSFSLSRTVVIRSSWSNYRPAARPPSAFACRVPAFRPRRSSLPCSLFWNDLTEPLPFAAKLRLLAAANRARRQLWL